MADATCWRIALSGMFRLAIATIVSRRYSASRGAVGVNRGQAAVVTGIHRLEHVERFFAADLADDDAIRTHTQGVDDQLALPNVSLAFDVGRTRFQPHHVPLTQHQFRRVFNRHDALGRRR